VSAVLTKSFGIHDLVSRENAAMGPGAVVRTGHGRGIDRFRSVLRVQIAIGSQLLAEHIVGRESGVAF